MSRDRLCLEDASYEARGRILLDSISLNLCASGVTGIVGPNGAGKTTLLRLLSGSLPPSRGRACLGAHDLAAVPKKELARRIARIPQSVLADFDFPAKDVVLMGRYPYRGRFESFQDEDHHAVRQAMERTDTLQFADRAITHLSGGERQRVHVARALAQAPEFLLLDEPMAHLDIQHELALVSLVRRLGRSRGIVIVVHDLNLAARLCDRLVLVSQGRVMASGRPEDVLTPERVKTVFGVRVSRRWDETISACQLTFMEDEHVDMSDSRPSSPRPAAEVPMTAETLLLAFVIKWRGRWADRDIAGRRRWLARNGIRLGDRAFVQALERARRRFFERPAELFVCRSGTCRQRSDFGPADPAFSAGAGGCIVTATECQGLCERAPAATLRVGDRCRVYSEISDAAGWDAVLDHARRAAAAGSLP